MQLPIGILFSVLTAANGLLPLTSPTRYASIPSENFSPHSHILGIHSTNPVGYLPSQIRKAYNLTASGSQGVDKRIVIVGAYSVPHLQADLAEFNLRTGTEAINGTQGHPSCTVAAGPHPCLEIRSTAKSLNSGWETEAALDSQWAHAIAPKADIIMVQAADSSARSLASAVTLATTLRPTTVSMSWGGSEFTQERDWDSTFAKARFVASSGDSGHGASFPATSPNVLSVGGTTLKLDSVGNRLTPEQAWAGSGGGTSAIEPRPLYQTGSWLTAAGQRRIVPDVSYNADPATGYAVYSNGSWLKVGGTSAGAPQWAALLTLGNAPLSNSILYKLGSGVSHANIFTDIKTGSNGHCQWFCSTRPGFDGVTGFGTPLAQGIITRS